jgi:tetratricopeptide (TPR) repeat protein
LAAADEAERSAAFADAVGHLRVALELLPAAAEERSSVLGRLGLTLVQAGFDEGTEVACDAARRIADREGSAAAAAYLAKVATALNEIGGNPPWLGRVTELGLAYAGERHDLTWATLKAFAILIASHDLGIPEDTAARREIAALCAPLDEPPGVLSWFLIPSSRAELEARAARTSAFLVVGQYHQDLPAVQQLAAEHERIGNLAHAIANWTTVSRFQVALGAFAEARETRARAIALAERSPQLLWAPQFLIAAEDEWRLATDDAWDAPLEVGVPDLRELPQGSQFRATFDASIARMHAHMGRVEPAMRRLAAVVPAIERAPGGADNYVRMICDAAATLWLTERTDHAAVIERNLREKVIEPDFRYPMMDARLALARLCALQRRYDEAVDWFGKARTVLDEQGARPLRAIVDYDEALMYVRRGAGGDRERAGPCSTRRWRSFGPSACPGGFGAPSICWRWGKSGHPRCNPARPNEA